MEPADISVAKETDSSRNKQFSGSAWILGPLLPVFMIAFLTSVAGIAKISLMALESKARQGAGQSLETIRDIAHEAVVEWVHARKRYLDNHAGSAELLDFISPVSPGSPLPVFDSDRIFHEAHGSEEDLGYSIISSDLSVSAVDRRLQGKLTANAFQEHKEKLAAAFKGQSVFCPPVHLEFSGLGKIPTLIFASPIRSDDGKVAGALLMISDPAKDFSKITRLGHLGRTGETFAVNSEAKLISESRYMSQLVDIGLLPAGQTAILNIRLMDPGERLAAGRAPKPQTKRRPLTVLAQNVLEGKTGSDTAGFRDYRGVRVMGAWTWDKDLGLGIGSKIDESEALEGYWQTESIVTKTILLIAAIAIISSITLVVSGRRNERRLVAAREEAEMASKAKTVFLASMSHELRTPLTSIIGFSEQIMTGNLGPLSSNQADAVLRISQAGEHLLAMVNDVLDLARAESGTIQMKMETVDLEYAVTRAICDVEPLAASFKAKIVMDKSFMGMKVYSDANHLDQILMNLLSNAVKFGPRRGVVNVTWERLEGLRIRLKVMDHGSGIPKDRMDQLFQPFNRLGKEGLNIKGSGVGLALSMRLASVIGGELGAASVEGKGTVFHLDLPQAMEHMEEKYGASPSQTKAVPSEGYSLEMADNGGDGSHGKANMRAIGIFS